MRFKVSVRQMQIRRRPHTTSNLGFCPPPHRQPVILKMRQPCLHATFDRRLNHPALLRISMNPRQRNRLLDADREVVRNNNPRGSVLLSERLDICSIEHPTLANFGADEELCWINVMAVTRLLDCVGGQLTDPSLR